MFDTIYELSLNKNYVQHWGLVEAVRELIQNAIDSESPFKYEFNVSGDDGVEEFYELKLTSEFTTLSAQTLLLGSTSKFGAPDKIGSFGEGYKIALLVLTRLGNKVEIYNGHKLWTPKFRYSKKYDDDLLIIVESTLSIKNKGLSVVVGGLTSENVYSIRESCLQMKESIGQIHKTAYGNILLDLKGMLYVGGMFVCETGLEFGYNIKPEYIKLERDRKTVDSFDLKLLTKNMWFETERYEEIAGMIESECEDLEYVKYDSPELVKEACYKLFRSKHPNAVVAKNQDELETLVKKGLLDIVVVPVAFHESVSKSESYIAETFVAVKPIQEQLQEWYDNSKYHMHDKIKESFKQIIKDSARWKR